MTPAAPQTAVLHAIGRPDIGASRAVSIAKNYYEKLMITAMFTLHPSVATRTSPVPTSARMSPATPGESVSESAVEYNECQAQ
jgi:hypothetical protein